MVTFYFCERVQENAADFKVQKEIRVMVHGVLHYADTRTREAEEIDALEDEKNWRCSMEQ
jgi:ssRNA-specific RNase YbeY (16S rRNA maturation enzyme)